MAKDTKPPTVKTEMRVSAAGPPWLDTDKLKDWAKTFLKESDKFHALIGQCITTWAYIDEQLFQIFRDCVGPYEQCAIIFYRAPGLDVRLGLTGEIVRSVLPKRERKNGGKDHDDVIRWNRIETKVRGLLSVRRRIAHQPVQGSAWEFTLPDFTKDFQSGFELYASVHERIRKDVPPLTAKDLIAHLVSLETARQELLNFRYSVLPKPPVEQPLKDSQTSPATSPEGD